MRRLLHSAVATLLLAVAAIARAQSADPRAALLVTPRWLNEHLRDANLVLLHVGPKKDYPDKHIAGARFIDMSDVSAPHDMSQGMKAGERMLEMPSPEQLRDKIAAFGISDDSRIVVYFDSEWISPATRVILTLDYAGLGKQTSLMDGGLPAWTGEGYATTAEVPAAKAGKLSPLRIKPVITTGIWVRDNAAKPGYALIDARAAVFYDGVEKGGPRSAQRSGHIPGAKSLPFTAPWDSAGRLLPATKLAELFQKAGVKKGDTVVGYCHIGQQATAMLFAARSLGFAYKLYDGSFEDWAYNDWPVEVPKKDGTP